MWKMLQFSNFNHSSTLLYLLRIPSYARREKGHSHSLLDLTPHALRLFDRSFTPTQDSEAVIFYLRGPGKELLQLLSQLHIALGITNNLHI